MGEVYRARDTQLGREVRVLASLNHPNTATLHGYEREEDTSFLIMELVEGETLADQIGRGPIPLDEALPLFIEIDEALSAAHDQGIIHRDLKPANIKVPSEGPVKVLDFGLAKAVGGDDAQSAIRTASADHADIDLGTASRARRDRRYRRLPEGTDSGSPRWLRSGTSSSTSSRSREAARSSCYRAWCGTGVTGTTVRSSSAG